VLHKYLNNLQHSHILQRAGSRGRRTKSREQRAEGREERG